MKNLLIFFLLFTASYSGYGQTYISMPTDSASWRYRIYTDDFLEDQLLFVNGTDTIANGYTYQKVFSRTFFQPGPFTSYPPVTSQDASFPDIYYGGIREAGKQVFFLGDTHEQLIYDFNAVAGDSIPGFSGKVRVVALDSILLDGVYHKRYITTDTSYFAIEGVGSSYGLLPFLTNNMGDDSFHCFSYPPTSYSPDTVIPCTYIYPLGYVSSAAMLNNRAPGIKVYPVPATDMVHITTGVSSVLQADILDYIGKVVWSGMVNEQSDICVASWPKGFYYLRIADEQKGIFIKKLVVE